MRKEKRSYLQVRMKCQIPSMAPSLAGVILYVDNPGIREKSEERGERTREPVQQSTRQVSCHVLEEKSQTCGNQTID